MLFCFNCHRNPGSQAWQFLSPSDDAGENCYRPTCLELCVRVLPPHYNLLCAPYLFDTLVHALRPDHNPRDVSRRCLRSAIPAPRLPCGHRPCFLCSAFRVCGLCVALGLGSDSCTIFKGKRLVGTLDRQSVLRVSRSTCGHRLCLSVSIRRVGFVALLAWVFNVLQQPPFLHQPR